MFYILTSWAATSRASTPGRLAVSGVELDFEKRMQNGQL